MTDKQLKFCDEYLVDMNATKAAIRAGYSPATAYSIGQRLLKNVEIKNCIEQLQFNLKNQSNLTKESVLNRLKDFGFADIDKTKITSKDAIKALEIISTMLGFNEPTIHNFEAEKQEKFLEAVKKAVSNTNIDT